MAERLRRDERQPNLSRIFGPIGLVKCIFVAMASSLFAILAPLTLSQVGATSAKEGVALHPVLAFFVAHPAVVSVLCVPALAAATLGLADRKRRWMWLIVATLFLLGVLAIMILALVALLKPLYQYQPL